MMLLCCAFGLGIRWFGFVMAQLSVLLFVLLCGVVVLCLFCRVSLCVACCVVVCVLFLCLLCVFVLLTIGACMMFPAVVVCSVLL